MQKSKKSERREAKLKELAALIVEDLAEELERREVYFTGPSESLSCDERDELLTALQVTVRKTLEAEIAESDE